MKSRFFYIPAQYPVVAEVELNQFISQTRIVDIEKHFVANGANSYWSVCVTWTEEQKPLPAQSQQNRSQRVDYKEILSETEFGIFAQLRDWRKKVAEREATPPYNVFNNEQLAAIVQQRISNVTELRKIDGIGQTRADKYAEELIAELQKIYATNTNHETS